MTVREQTEQLEKMSLSERACLSANTKGREVEIEKCPLRTEFQRDRDKIIHCNAFRRLKTKTQVFLSPEKDHYRTRLTHTLEVSQIGRTIARAMRLNEDLTEAVALGHDLGHTPFGHAGERALDSVCSFRFKHYEQSVRVVERLESLNLTWEVRDGIGNHTNGPDASTLEGQIVWIADRIAYLNHDIDDAIRAGILNKEDIPRELTEILGDTHSGRINTMVTSVVEASADSKIISMMPDVQKATDDLRAFLFENVYLNPRAKTEEVKAKDVVCTLFDYYVKHPEGLPERYRRRIGSESGETVERAVADFISGMTDRYAIEVYEAKYVPRVWRGLQE